MCYEKLLNDLYHHLLQVLHKQDIPEGTVMIAYAKEFAKDKSYYDGFLYEINNGNATEFLSELSEMTKTLKKKYVHALSKKLFS